MRATVYAKRVLTTLQEGELTPWPVLGSQGSRLALPDGRCSLSIDPALPNLRQPRSVALHKAGICAPQCLFPAGPVPDARDEAPALVAAAHEAGAPCGCSGREPLAPLA